MRAFNVPIHRAGYRAVCGIKSGTAVIAYSVRLIQRLVKCEFIESVSFGKSSDLSLYFHNFCWNECMSFYL